MLLVWGFRGVGPCRGLVVLVHGFRIYGFEHPVPPLQDAPSPRSLSL